jgi:hypothetical protein
MKNETIVTLQKLVLERMSPGQPPMDEQEQEQWVDWLPEISASVLNTMSKAVFSFHSDKLIKRHLSQIRKECTIMLDALDDDPEFTANWPKLHQMVVDCLLGILQHLRLNYNKYLDTDLAMPKLLYHAAVLKLEADTIPMVTAMTRYHADKRLQAVVVGKMTGLLKKGFGTWHQIAYLEKLQGSIMRLCTGPVTNVTDQLRVLLLRANFNTSGFLSYCKDQIDDKMAECYELSERYDCLFHYQQEFSCIAYRHKSKRFEPGQPKVKEVLLEYVNAALRRLNTKRRIANEKKTMTPAEQTCKLPVSITVDVLAYFFRLLMTAGVVTSSKGALLLFISRSFRTPGGGDGDISLKSIDNKYRQVVKNTSITVRSILMKMLKQLDDDFK